MHHTRQKYSLDHSLRLLSNHSFWEKAATHCFQKITNFVSKRADIAYDKLLDTKSLKTNFEQYRSQYWYHEFVSSLVVCQAVAHDSVNEENESAYWTDRYVLRMTRPANLDVSQNIHPEMPKFLEPCRDAVLTTGQKSPRFSKQDSIHAKSLSSTIVRNITRLLCVAHLASLLRVTILSQKVQSQDR